MMKMMKMGKLVEHQLESTVLVILIGLLISFVGAAKDDEAVMSVAAMAIILFACGRFMFIAISNATVIAFASTMAAVIMVVDVSASAAMITAIAAVISVIFVVAAVRIGRSGKEKVALALITLAEILANFCAIYFLPRWL